MAMDNLGEALGRFQSSGGSEPKEEPEAPEMAEKSGGKHEGHSGHIHKHKNGKHHVTVHDKNGQLTHHSEHGSWNEAAQELGQHGAGGPSENSEPGEAME